VLCGPSGANKTAMVYHCASIMGLRVIEAHPGMVRSESKLNRRIHEATQSMNIATSARNTTPNNNNGVSASKGKAGNRGKAGKGRGAKGKGAKAGKRGHSTSAVVDSEEEEEEGDWCYGIDESITNAGSACAATNDAKHLQKAMVLVDEADIVCEEDVG